MNATSAAGPPAARCSGDRVAIDPDWQNITDPIFHWAEVKPDAPAFHQGPETLTYGALATLVGKAAVHLDGLGIRAGERIAINLSNSIDHFILTLGLLRLGATTLEIPYSAQRPVAPELLSKFAVRRIFIEPLAAPVAGVAAIKVDAGWRARIMAAKGDDRRATDNGDAIFTISMTSGTTGEPKGSLTTHRQYFQRLRAYTDMFAASGVFSTDNPANFLLTASVGYTTFFRRMISHLFIGGPQTILPDFLHNIDLVRAIGRYDNALCFVTSAMCRVLIACAPQSGLLYPKLRALIAGGGFVYPDEKVAMLDKVTPHFYECYGASGFGTIAVLTPQDIRVRPGSVGCPPSFVEVQVVDEAGSVLPPGAIGRLRCRGTAGKGFAADVDPASDERFRDGWYYPGDFAQLDADGYVFLRGRGSETIHRNNTDIFPAEIEAVIAQHPGVADVAVVGVPRPLPGDELVALVVTRGQTPHEALAQFCRTRLPADRWPERIFYIQALPKTGGGKLDRARVRAIVMDEISRRAAR